MTCTAHRALPRTWITPASRPCPVCAVVSRTHRCTKTWARLRGYRRNSGTLVSDEDPSHYCNPQLPAIDIEKATNGVDADNPNAGDAPQVMSGEPVNWTYVVTNTGKLPLFNVEVEDDQVEKTSQSRFCTSHDWC